jgi:putative transposase
LLSRLAAETWCHVADQLLTRRPMLGSLMDDPERDALAYMTHPIQNRAKFHNANPVERLNKEEERRADTGYLPH